MARYRVVGRSPKFIPVVLDAQIQPGSFEYALDYLVDRELDLGALHARYNNDLTGAPAYDPAVLLTCDAQGLIGKQMFAIDGVKLPSNASKERGGRFTLRTQPKVNTQWTRYCLVHNIEKLAKAGFAK